MKKIIFILTLSIATMFASCKSEINTGNADIDSGTVISSYTDNQYDMTNDDNIEDITAVLESYSQKALLLPKPIESYKIIKAENAVIDGINCRGVQIYSDSEDGENIETAGYYYLTPDNILYVYDVSNDVYVLLHKDVIDAENDDPNKILDEAFEIASNFYLGGFRELDLNDSIEKKDTYGNIQTYYKVCDEQYNTSAKLYSTLSCYFSSSVIEDMLASANIFIDSNNVYGLDGGRGANIFIESYSVQKETISSNECCYNVTVKYTDDWDGVNPEEYIFKLKKSGNTWVFTEFPYFF